MVETRHQAALVRACSSVSPAGRIAALLPSRRRRTATASRSSAGREMTAATGTPHEAIEPAVRPATPVLIPQIPMINHRCFDEISTCTADATAKKSDATTAQPRARDDNAIIVCA